MENVNVEDKIILRILDYLDNFEFFEKLTRVADEFNGQSEQQKNDEPER